VCTTKLTLFAMRKVEWDKEGSTGKSMKDAMYVQWYGKRNLVGCSELILSRNGLRIKCN